MDQTPKENSGKGKYINHKYRVLRFTWLFRAPPFLGVHALWRVVTTVVSISVFVLRSPLIFTGVMPAATLLSDFENDIAIHRFNIYIIYPDKIINLKSI